MRNDCAIVSDLLPLYVENMVSKDTAAYVRDHLSACESCRREAAKLNAPVPAEIPPEAVPLKKLKKKLQRKRIHLAALTVLLVSICLTALFSWLTAPRYFPYTDDLLRIRENGDGSLTVQFSENVTACRLYQTAMPDGAGTAYHLESWTTTWDGLFQKRGNANAVVEPDAGEAFALYYVQNSMQNGQAAEDVLLYGDAACLPAGAVSLPGLSLWYLLIASGAAFLLLDALWLIWRGREKTRRRVENLLLLPLSYAVGHLCVLGVQAHSFAEQRDFSLIVLVGTLVYCALRGAVTIVRSRRMEGCG